MMRPLAVSHFDQAGQLADGFDAASEGVVEFLARRDVSGGDTV
jgi:hypothetical protein